MPQVSFKNVGWGGALSKIGGAHGGLLPFEPSDHSEAVSDDVAPEASIALRCRSVTYLPGGGEPAGRAAGGPWGGG